MPGIEARAPERTRDEQRIAGVAEGLAAGTPPDLGQRRLDLAFEVGWIGLVMSVEVRADLGREREAGRHRQAEMGHFGEVGALAAEQVAHRGPPSALPSPKA